MSRSGSRTLRAGSRRPQSRLGAALGASAAAAAVACCVLALRPFFLFGAAAPGRASSVVRRHAKRSFV